MIFSYKLVLIWYIYSMVITNMYMSVLIKQMTHTHYVGSVESLKDVLNQNLIPLMFERSSSIASWKQSSDQTLRLILRISVMVYSPDSQINRRKTARLP